MLLEFGGRNFYSFKEGFQVSLREKGKSVSNLLAIKGANASGKTNVLKALSFLGFFTIQSFRLKDDEQIPLSSFFKNNEPISLYAIFKKGTKEYKYEINLTSNNIINESFYEKDKLILERQEDNIIVGNNKFEELKKIIIRPNVSLISSAKQYTIKSLDVFYNFFQSISSNVSEMGFRKEFINYRIASRFYHNTPVALRFAKLLIGNIDMGISNIEIKEDEDPETNKKIFYPIFHYNINGDNKTLSYAEQSSGTQTLFRHLGIYGETIVSGGILILDELDITLHPDLIPVLLNLFKSKESNERNAQLLFTTHNTEIMDKLTKYHIVLVNKEENESYLYRLDETGEIIRNDRPISTIYNTGRLGGKPKIELDYD